MLRLSILLVGAIIFVAAGGITAADSAPAKDAGGAGHSMATSTDTSYLSLPFLTITGDTTNLDHFAGKVVLIVNTASKCGFTPQYKGLEELYNKYKDKGLVVIGFPANNFANQEPGTNQEIQQFCTSKYDVTFPMMSKISVKGDDINPLYVYLTERSPKPGEITWNFNKFLLDRQGRVVARFDSKIEPMSKEIVSAVEAQL
jgi:glutathione peroxidase